MTLNLNNSNFQINRKGHLALHHPGVLHVTVPVPPSPFSHSATATQSSNFTDCAICFIGRSVMGHIVELPRGRRYGSESVTNDNRTFAATNS